MGRKMILNPTITTTMNVSMEAHKFLMEYKKEMFGEPHHATLDRFIADFKTIKEMCNKQKKVIELYHNRIKEMEQQIVPII